MQAREITEIGNSLYREARENAGIKPRAAADALNISISTLRRYEVESPPDHTVKEMARLYQNKRLLYQWITNNMIWQDVMPCLDYENFGTSVANLAHCIMIINLNMHELIEQICCSKKHIGSEVVEALSTTAASCIEILAQINEEGVHD